MAPEKQIEAQLQLVREAGAPLPPATYANFINVTFTPEDFSIHLGLYSLPLEVPEEGAVVVAKIQDVGRVVLPLNLVKNLIALLQRQVTGYEANFGPIPEHPNKPPWMTEDKEQ